MHILKKEVTISGLKTMASGDYRITVDLGELTGDEVKELHELKREGVLSLILTSSSALKQVIDERYGEGNTDSD